MRSAVVVPMIILSGCSFVLTHGPSSPPPGAPNPAAIECTQTAGAPVADLMLGAVTLALAVSPATRYSDDSGGHLGFGAVLYLPSAIYFASALYGIVVVSNCHSAIEHALGAPKRTAPPAWPPGRAPTPSPPPASSPPPIPRLDVAPAPASPPQPPQR